MRILHIIQRYHPYIGGSELYFQELSERLARAGHRVEVWTTDAWDLDYFWSKKARRVHSPRDTHNGVRIRRFPVRHMPLPAIYYRAWRRLMAEISDITPRSVPLLYKMCRITPWVPALRRALRDLLPGTFDMVHTANIPFEAMILAAAEYAERAGIPHIITPFTHLGEPGDRSISRYYTMPHQLDLERRASKVIVQTRLERDFLADLGIPARKMERVGVGVNPYEVVGGDGERFRRKYGVEGPIIYYIGAAAYDKGTTHAIEAMQRVWARGTDATFLMAGSTMLDKFKDYYQGLPQGVRDRCRWLGFIPDEDKRDLQAAGQVFCMPSRTDSFGIVYLEAWLNGVPVIGANAGGVPEIISSGVDGYLVDFGDVAALANRIQLLLQRPEVADEMGQAGRRKVLAEHTWDHKIARIAEIYREVRDQESGIRGQNA
ncbi:MAG TPA: glycosyltransferase family 4 protein [Chloroflexia bacterium]|nr:glycosyltransferase family 4 protein [Chloroflexia bacterium]